MSMKQYITDVYPLKAQFLNNEKIEAAVEMFNEEDEARTVDIEVKIYFLSEVSEVSSYSIDLPAKEKKTLLIAIDPKDEDFKGYGLDVYLYSDGNLLQVFSSAFDVVSDWRKATRYGFLCDFYPEDTGDIEDIQSMCKLHLNLVQFYDWMYRHDELIPPVTQFKDLMGRELSYGAVLDKVRNCHKHGMKAIAYGAVYAASCNFYGKHKDWALYDSSGKVFSLGELFFIMNISPDSPWHGHIIEQYKNAVCLAGFDGIHMDTYGFPKTAVSKLNGIDKIESLKEHFPILINDTRKTLGKIKGDVCLIFNNVGNWPVDAVAKAEQDAIYIEVWKPYERYHHIRQIILHAKYVSGGKPVILAAYLKPFSREANESRKNAEAAALILTAAITSNGGYHLLLGEKNGLLTQGYYADYARYDSCFMRIMRNYYDFIIRYSNIFFDNTLEDVSMTHADGDNQEYVFENFQYSTYGEPGKVWVILREKPERKTISFINLKGNTDDFWNIGKNRPDKVPDLSVKIQVEREIKSLFMATPDSRMGRIQVPDYCVIDGERGKTLVVNIKNLDVWTILVIDFAVKEQGVNEIDRFEA